MKIALVSLLISSAAYAGSAGEDLVNDPNGEPQKIKKTAQEATNHPNEFFGAVKKRVKKSTDEISEKVKKNTEKGQK